MTINLEALQAAIGNELGAVFMRVFLLEQEAQQLRQQLATLSQHLTETPEVKENVGHTA